MVEAISPDKSQAARTLAEWNRQVDPAISRVFRVVSESEDDAREPLKILEVNLDTSPSGIFPVAFSADPPTIPFPFIVMEVTEGEFEDIKAGTLLLPDGWKLAEAIYQPAA